MTRYLFTVSFSKVPDTVHMCNVRVATKEQSPDNVVMLARIALEDDPPIIGGEQMSAQSICMLILRKVEYGGNVWMES